MEPGSVIEGRYEVERALASGGMATVWRVRHQALDSLHALKILHLPSPDIRERLLLEGRLQAKLRHPNIVAVTDVLTVDGNPGLVMEYVEGPSLEGWLTMHRPEPDQVEQLFLSILAAVDHAHSYGVVHRDLKPANVLLAPLSGGVMPKVADFGIARVIDDVLEAKAPGRSQTRSGVMMGTPQYMAPEQSASASHAGPAADMFALGCILFEMALGQPAFDGPHVGAILLKVANQDYPDPVSIDPDIRPGVAEAIRRTLVADPNQRLANCSEMAGVLTEGRVKALSGVTENPIFNAPRRKADPSATTVPNPQVPSHVTTSSNPALLAGIAVGGMTLLAGTLLLALALAGVAALWWMRPDDPTPDVVIDATPPVEVEPEPAVVAPAPAVVAPAPIVEPAVVEPAPAPEPVPVVEPAVVEPAPVVEPAVVVQPAPVVAPAPAPVVAPAPSGDWAVAVRDWRRSADTRKGSVLSYRAPEGRELLLVDVEVRYQGAKATEPISPWRLRVRGTKDPVEASARCGVAVPNALSSIARYTPDSVTRGTLCFEVPRGTKPRSLRFASGLQGGTEIDLSL